MEINSIHFPYEPGEIFNFSLFEAHMGAQLFDEDKFHRIMTRRCAKIPNHFMLGQGDTNDLIMPRDEKRYQPSASIPEIVTHDNFLNKAEEYTYKQLSPYWEYILQLMKGNHETAIEKRSGYDITSGLVRLLREKGSRVVYGGYSNFLRLVFIPKSSKPHVRADHRVTVTMLNHHWRGGASNLPEAAIMSWLSHFTGWDIATFGHIHKEASVTDTALSLSPKQDELIAKTRLVVFAGAFLKAYSGKGTMPDYAEVKAYSPKFIGSPMIRIQPTGGGAERAKDGLIHNNRFKAQVITGDDF